MLYSMAAAPSEKYKIGTRSQCENMVNTWGFSHVFTWTDPRYVSINEGIYPIMY